MKHETIGNIGQWLSVFIMLVGIGLLWYYRIDLGTIVFTVGCVVETLSTKIKYYGNLYLEKSRKFSELVLYDGKSECVETPVVDSDASETAMYL